MKDQRTNSLKSPFAKKILAADYRELYEMSLNMSSEVKKYEETMTNEESENEGVINRLNRVRKKGRGYSKCVHVRTRVRWDRKIGHKVCTYKTDEP